VDESILREIKEVDAEVDRLERLIAAKHQEIEAVHASFELRRARLEVLLDED
jgi:predicted  nucleic acid-binding Zn-ribbon protein